MSYNFTMQHFACNSTPKFGLNHKLTSDVLNEFKPRKQFMSHDEAFNVVKKYFCES